MVWDADTAARYDEFNPPPPGAMVDRLAALAAGGPALEFAIGTGRVAIPLAGRGVPVTGIELSEPMVARLREKADLPVVIGDMATTRAPGSFAVAYLVFNTISNLLTQAAQVECFRNAARHLRPGGCFVIELGVPDVRRLPPGQDAVVWQAGDGYIGLDTYDVMRQHLVSYHVRFDEGRSATLDRSSHRYIWPAELDLMAELAGFALESREADWSGTPFTAESGSHVSVYRLTVTGT